MSHFSNLIFHPFTSSIGVLVIVLLHALWNRPLTDSVSGVKAVVVSCNILITNLQLIAIFETVAIDWPPAVQTVFATLKVLRLNINILNPGCGMKITPAEDYAARILMPLVCVVIAGACVALGRSLHRVRDRESLPYLLQKVAAKMPPIFRLRRYLLNTIGQIYMMLGAAMSVTAFLPFQCDDHPGGRRTVREWPSVECSVSRDESEKYIPLICWSVLGIVVYVVTAPSYCIWQVLNYGIDSVTDPSFFLKNKFLFSNFKPSAKFFGLCVFCRGIMIAVISTLMGDVGPVVQVASTAAVLVIYMFKLVQYEPWVFWLLNRLDQFGCMCLFIIIILGLAFVNDDSDTTVVVVVVLSCMVLFAIIFGGAIIVTIASAVVPRYDFPSVRPLAR